MKAKTKKTAAPRETHGDKAVRLATTAALKAARAAAKALGPDAPPGPLSRLRFAVADLERATRQRAAEKRAATRAGKVAKR